MGNSTGVGMIHPHLTHLWGEGQVAAQGELIDWKGIYERTSGYPFALTNTFFFIHKRATFLDFSAHDCLLLQYFFKSIDFSTRGSILACFLDFTEKVYFP